MEEKSTKLDISDNSIKKDNFKLVYTFKLEKDGIYKFISMVKKNK